MAIKLKGNDNKDYVLWRSVVEILQDLQLMQKKAGLPPKLDSSKVIL